MHSMLNLKSVPTVNIGTTNPPPITVANFTANKYFAAHSFRRGATTIQRRPHHHSEAMDAVDWIRGRYRGVCKAGD